MNETTNEFNEIQHDIELADTLKRLRQNKDFQKLIEELYLDGGAINLTKNLVVVKNKEELYDQFNARSWLYRFFLDIEMNGEAAIESIRQLNEQEEG